MLVLVLLVLKFDILLLHVYILLLLLHFINKIINELNARVSWYHHIQTTNCFSYTVALFLMLFSLYIMFTGVIACDMLLVA